MPTRRPQRTANSHSSSKHDSGLAPPGRKVVKQRSSTSLNGHANGKPASPVVPSALPSTGLSGSTFPRASDAAAPLDAAVQPVIKDHDATLEATARDSTSSELSAEESALDADMADEAADSHTPELVVESTASACKGHVCRSHAAVSTILSSYPLRDAISILIVLLSLPPTLVLVVQTLFASLTFVPPTAGITLTSLLNLREMFLSSNLGYPALVTILLVDILLWLFWLPLPKSLQNIVLDLSQAVIAVSLSGAAAGNSRPTYPIGSSVLIVCVVHLLRYRAIHLTTLDYLRSVLHKMEVGIELVLPQFGPNSLIYPPPTVERGWLFTVVRTILGIHIVSQGITNYIRRSLVRANERDQAVGSVKSDSEAAGGGEQTSRSGSSPFESSQMPPSASSTDGRTPGLPPAQREGKARESSSKKKRKQANAARSLQPLWAAVASTKVAFVKEMEQKDAVDDAREAAAMDTDTSISFTSTIDHSTDHIWISEIRDSEILFSVDLTAESSLESADRREEGVTLSAGIDRSMPFYIRINGAAWSSTRLMSSATGNEWAGKSGARFDGEIFGLAPLSSYHCEVVGIASGRTFCSASLITQAAPSAEQTAAVTPSQTLPQALRPSSPITTLKQSIQSADAKLQETRNRTKKTRKDQRGVHSDIRKEISQLRSKLDSSGGSDDKWEKRLQQISQTKHQAEIAIADIKKQIHELGDVPADEHADVDAKRRTYLAAMEARHEANKDLDHAKVATERDIKELKTEVWNAKSKRDKLTTRLAQRKEELEKLLQRKQAEASAKHRREHERAKTVLARETEEKQLRYHMASFEHDIQMLSQKTHATYQQIAALQSWPPTQHQGPGLFPAYSSPPTPEGTLPGTNGSLSPQPNGFPPFALPAFHSPVHAHPNALVGPPPPQPTTRGRSSSMLSQYSGFTDNGEEYAFEPHRQSQTWPVHAMPVVPPPVRMTDDRKGSEASASGSGSGSDSLKNGSAGSNSPRQDAKPCVSKHAAPPGPIGPPSKQRDKVALSSGLGW